MKKNKLNKYNNKLNQKNIREELNLIEVEWRAKLLPAFKFILAFWPAHFYTGNQNSYTFCYIDVINLHIQWNEIISNLSIFYRYASLSKLNSEKRKEMNSLPQ